MTSNVVPSDMARFVADLENGRGSAPASTEQSHSSADNSKTGPPLRRISRQHHYSRPNPACTSPISLEHSSSDNSIVAGQRKPCVGQSIDESELDDKHRDTHGRRSSLPSPMVRTDAHAGLPPPPEISVTPPPGQSSKARRNSSASRLSTSSQYFRRNIDVIEASKLRQQLSSPSGTLSVISTAAEKTRIPDSFAERVFEAGRADLLYDVARRRRFKETIEGVVDLTMLERMSLHVMQAKLVERVRLIGERKAWQEIGVAKLLHEYCDALRDLEYMEKRVSQDGDQDPFLISTFNGLQSKLLEDAGLVVERHTAIDKYSPGDRVRRLTPTPRKGECTRWFRRQIMALAGGLALLVPFITMTTVSGTTAKLVTTCLCIAGFSFVVGLASDISPELGALLTLAYAGVLVVFVGSSPDSYAR